MPTISMAMTQEPIDWRYLPYIRPIFQAYVREYPHKIWPYMVLTYLHFRILEFPLSWAMTMAYYGYGGSLFFLINIPMRYKH